MKRKKIKGLLPPPGRPEPAGAAGGLVQALRLFPGDTAHRCHHELGDAVAALEGHRLLAEVDQDHLDLAAITLGIKPLHN